jgi:hypothetical protein
MGDEEVRKMKRRERERECVREIELDKRKDAVDL